MNIVKVHDQLSLVFNDMVKCIFIIKTCGYLLVVLTYREYKDAVLMLLGWLVGFYGISTSVGYFIPNHFYTNNQFYLKQFTVYSLIIKNISTSSYSF